MGGRNVGRLTYHIATILVWHGYLALVLLLWRRSIGSGWCVRRGLEEEFENFERVRRIRRGGCDAEVVVGWEGNFLAAEAKAVIDENFQATCCRLQAEFGWAPKIAIDVVAVAEGEGVNIRMASVFDRAVVEETPDALAAIMSVQG